VDIYLDQTRCTCCFPCVVACKDKHDVPAGPASWRRLKTIEKGEHPDPGFLTNHCYHSGTPACVSTCTAGAISKREKDGIVVVARDSSKLKTTRLSRKGSSRYL
jgi:anaerobic dimethyl sulfoxide reductase subunit B (iron-sulfur subunit)